MAREKMYLLSGGIVPLLENRYGFSLDKNIKTRIRVLEQDYFKEMHGLLNGRKESDDEGEFSWKVEFMGDEDIDHSMRKVIAAKRVTERPLVTFDDVYCVDLADGKYHVTRINDPFDLSKKAVSGPRLGYVSLEEQVRSIRESLGDEIDVIDIGVFEGDTLINEARRFGNEGVKINNVYTAFAGKAGIKNLAGIGINLHPALTVDWVDWLELRDCIGFDGRKVLWQGDGEKPKGFFVRYDLKPSWASIPEGMEGKFTQLYDSYFAKVAECLRISGLNASLNKSDHASGNVYELRITR